MARLLLICFDRGLRKNVDVLIGLLNLFSWICRCLLRVALRPVSRYCNFRKSIGRGKESLKRLKCLKRVKGMVNRSSSWRKCLWGLKVLKYFLNKNFYRL